MLALAAGVGGCAFFELVRQADRIQRGVATVQGEVRAEPFDDGAALVLVLSRDAPPGERHPVDVRLFRKPGPFLFVLAPGRYEIAAYEERTGDLVYCSGDPVWLSDEALTVAAGDRIQGLVLAPRPGSSTLPARFDLNKETGATALSPTVEQLGEVVSLDDPRLSLEMGRMGLWRPGDYLEELEAGLFFLEPYDEHKTPVLFVHGIGGGPVQFRPLIESLDRSRYQPWLFAYPSALPLSMIANGLHQMMDALDRMYAFERVYIVAHSMGGLVARGFVNEYTAAGYGDYLRLMVTIATPFAGHAGARLFPGEDPPTDAPLGSGEPLSESAAVAQPSASGVLHLSWRDMKPGPPGDGVVTLSSQLREEAQREAQSQRGFALDHDAVLESPALSEHLARLFAAGEGR